MDAVPVAGNIVDGSVNVRGSIIVGIGINGGKNIVDGRTADGIRQHMATRGATEGRDHASQVLHGDRVAGRRWNALRLHH